MKSAEPPVVKQPRRTALRATTLMESIYQDILSRLQHDQIGDDERLLDYEIAKEFECTRMPVRQALLRLVNEGYLVATTRGFVIPVLSAVDVREIFAMRRLLEPAAAVAAAMSMDEQQLIALQAATRKCKRGHERHDMALLMQGNIEFRQTWLGAVQNSRLRNSILRFSDHSRQVRTTTRDKADTARMISHDLQAIMAGFQERDAAQIHAAVIGFIDDAEHQYFLGQDVAA
ncbi:GntR family transcriptional regulator [Herbaspirillum sp. alder98]|uniref:GntR family transcriptional regulator n=1 Tax=Herbaspirillum sp. alder98 TaxID=2913096 RepID=UPI001CD8818D|nr:GntR family transcriptional regulator [Herbaspirillum sp. alder98]MCA1325361.1 GntR family transcriptional regulator [Herbaspirillum sp. alder98]